MRDPKHILLLACLCSGCATTTPHTPAPIATPIVAEHGRAKPSNLEVLQKLDSITIPEVEFRQADPLAIHDYLLTTAFEFDESGSDRRGLLILIDCMYPSRLPVVTIPNTRNMTMRELLSELCQAWEMELHIREGAALLKPKNSQQENRAYLH